MMLLGHIWRSCGGSFCPVLADLHAELELKGPGSLKPREVVSGGGEGSEGSGGFLARRGIHARPIGQ